MSSTVSADLRQLLDRARDSHDESLGRLLQLYVPYLKLMARTRLDAKVRARASPSDVVQETLLRAHRDFAQFRGATTEEFSAWLSAILINQLRHLIQHHLTAKKRDVRREVSIDDAVATLERSAARLVSVLAEEGPSPSSDAFQREASLVLADALESLPAPAIPVATSAWSRTMSASQFEVTMCAMRSSLKETPESDVSPPTYR